MNEFEKVLYLGEREYKVFCLMGEGYDGTEIAEKLSIDRRTIGTYRDKFKWMFNARNYVHIVTIACRYNESGLKRVLIPNKSRHPRYKFVESNKVVNLKVA